MMREKVAKVAVLLATHNGINWLAEQINSILGQQDVDVRLIVSDDASTDGTLQWLKTLAQEDDRVVLLPCSTGYGSAGKNFYRLVLEADISDCDYVALADQDDIWLKSKLKDQISLSVQHGTEGVSSNVVAFWPDGSRGLINKATPMRRLDFIFESAGPGCTFLLSPWLINQVRVVLSDANGVANQVELHDWLIYAVCRALDRKWYINPVPTMKYRQHANNVIGVNYGVKARLKRFRHIYNGWYRQEVVKICMVCRKLSRNAYVQAACDTIIDQRPFARFRLLTLMPETRRNAIDRLVLTISSLLFLF